MRKTNPHGTEEQKRNSDGPLLDRLPPNSVDAEQAALGAALISRPATTRVLELLGADDYYVKAHRWIHEVMAFLDVQAQPVDTLTVQEELRRRGQLEQIGGVAYLLQLADSVPTAAHVDYYAEIVQKKSLLRRLMKAGQEITHRALSEEDQADTLLDAAAVLVGDLGKKARRRRSPTVYSAKQLRDMKFPPVTWLIERLLPVPAVALLAGAPKTKKSFLTLDIACALALGGYALGQLKVERADCLCCYTEDSFEDVKERLERQFQDGDWPENLHVTDECPRMDEGGEGWLDAFLTEHPAVRYVVLDPLVNVRGAGRNSQGNAYHADYDDLAVFKRLARRHRVALVIIHHTSKKISDDPFQIISGTQGILGSVDVAMVLQTDAEVEHATLHAKGRRVRPLKWGLTWNNQVGWVFNEDLAGAAAANQGTQQQRAALDALRNGPLNYGKWIAAIREALECSEGAAKALITRLKKSDRVLREGSIYWLAPEAAGGFPEGNAPEGNAAEPGVTPVTPLPPADFSHELLPGEGNGGGNAGAPLGGNGVTSGGHAAEREPLPLSPYNPCLDLEGGNGGNGGNAPPATVTPAALPPEEPDPDLAALRWRVRTLAAERGFPPLINNGQKLGEGEEFWARLCHSQPYTVLEQAEALLDAYQRHGATAPAPEESPP